MYVPLVGFIINNDGGKPAELATWKEKP